MTTPLRPTGLRIKPTRRPRGPGVAAPLRSYMWKKEQSGNPSGYNSVMYNLATLVRRLSGDGAELVAFYFAVLRGEPFAVVGYHNLSRPHHLP